METTLVALLSASVTITIFAVGLWQKAINDVRRLQGTISSLTDTVNEFKMNALVSNEVMKAVKSLAAEKTGG